MSSDGTSFNLMDRGWIPSNMLADSSRRELSITEVLDHAREIRGIDGDMPLQQFTISRLLIAILYGAFGHTFSADQWQMLMREGPDHPDIAQAIHEYCSAYHGRFDLFDDIAPFYQVAGLHTAKNEVSGLECLLLDVSNRREKRVFTTKQGIGLDAMDAAQAARWLVTLQAYDASGIKSGAVGDPRVKGGKGYPIGVAWSGHLGGILIEGENLWETLMLNFVSDQVLELSDANVDWDDDMPIWERDPLTEQASEGYDQSAERVADTTFFHGPATLMTWQSRRVLLAHDGETVTGAVVCNGDRLKPQNGRCYEPMTGWRRSPAQEKALKLPLVYMPRKHDPSRALWRGLPLLTNNQQPETSEEPASIRPQTLKWLTQAQGDSARRPIRLHAFGVEYGNNDAVIDTSVNDVLDLNLVTLTSNNFQMAQLLQEAVNLTDQGVLALRNLASNIALAGGMPTDPPRQRAGELGYATFDGAFRRWVKTIESDDDLPALRRDWFAIARRLFIRLGSQLTEQASPRALVGREITIGDQAGKYYSAPLAEIWYRSKINQLFPLQEGE